MNVYFFILRKSPPLRVLSTNSAQFRDKRDISWFEVVWAGKIKSHCSQISLTTTYVTIGTCLWTWMSESVGTSPVVYQPRKSMSLNTCLTVNQENSLTLIAITVLTWTLLLKHSEEAFRYDKKRDLLKDPMYIKCIMYIFVYLDETLYILVLKLNVKLFKYYPWLKKAIYKS